MDNAFTSANTVAVTVERWHQHMLGEPGVLDEILADDVVFYSPVVYSPQHGKAITAKYLTAAAATFAGPSENTDGSTAFRYTKQVVAGDTAVLEFETSMDGKYVNGVDIIRVNDTGRIIEFRVMVRPLQALNTVHRMMGVELERMTDNH
jgi:SnoaL-like domain